MSCSGFLSIRGRARVSGCSSLCFDLPISVHGSKAFPHCQSWWDFWCWEWSGEARGRASARVSPSSANSSPWADIALTIEANSFQLCPAAPLALMPVCLSLLVHYEITWPHIQEFGNLRCLWPTEQDKKFLCCATGFKDVFTLPAEGLWEDLASGTPQWRRRHLIYVSTALGIVPGIHRGSAEFWRW